MVQSRSPRGARLLRVHRRVGGGPAARAVLRGRCGAGTLRIFRRRSARRTSGRRLGGILIVALPALNTGNNLLFLILASLIAVILMSGVLSSITLSGVAMRLELPEHIFAGQTVRARIELENEI